MSSPEAQEHSDEIRVRGDVAVIGMACVFPGAPDLDTFWHNIVNKVDAITDVPPERWDPDIFFDPKSFANDRVYSKRGGYLTYPVQFNPSDVTISAGDTVTWKNDEGVPHDVDKESGPGAQFSSGPQGGMMEGDTFKHTFDKPGTYKYICRVHAPGMAGTIIVK